MQNTYTLYGDLRWTTCRPLYILLKHRGSFFKFKAIDTESGEHLTSAHEKITPFKIVPVVTDTVHNHVFTGSIATAKYLCKTLSRWKRYYPASKTEQYEIDRYLDWHLLNTEYLCNSYVSAKLKLQSMPEGPMSVQNLEEYQKRLDECLTNIENVWLKNKKVLANNAISIADLYAACAVEQLRMVGENPRNNRSILADWLRRITNKFEPVYSQAHSEILKYEEQWHEKDKITMREKLK